MDVDDVFKKLSAGAVFTKRPQKSSKRSLPDMSKNNDEAVKIIVDGDHSTTSGAEKKTKKNKKTKIIEVERVRFSGR